MNQTSEYKKTETTPARTIMPNMIIIAGDGRNSGKTYLACKIIKHLSADHEVLGIKITPHFHKLTADAIIIAKEKDFMVLEERALSGKDSSLMLQSGANRIFLIMAEDQALLKAMKIIREQIHDRAVVVESGGLIRFIEPGLFFFLKKTDEIEKQKYLDYNPHILFNLDPDNAFDPGRITFSEGKMKLND